MKKNTIIEFLQNLNDYCYRNSTTKTFYVDNYEFVQVQEKDRQGWTLVYKDEKIIGYINWQNCGCHAETTDEEFCNYLIENTRGYDNITHGLSDPTKTEEDESYADTISRILLCKYHIEKLENSKVC